VLKFQNIESSVKNFVLFAVTKTDINIW